MTGVTIADQEFAVGDRVIARRNDRYRDIDNGSIPDARGVSPFWRRSGLLPPAPSAWRWEPEYLAADHRLSDRVWGELGHLLSNDSHLLAVGVVYGKTEHFLTQCRSHASTRSRFT